MLILKPSKIHGIGVFTTRPIKHGQKLPLFGATDLKLRKKATGFQRRYSVKNEQGWHGPTDFHQMSIGWYLNDGGTKSNVTDERSLKFIRAGEELLIDYKTLY